MYFLFLFYHLGGNDSDLVGKALAHRVGVHADNELILEDPLTLLTKLESNFDSLIHRRFAFGIILSNRVSTGCDA